MKPIMDCLCYQKLTCILFFNVFNMWNDVVGGGKPDLVQRQMTIATHTHTKYLKAVWRITFYYYYYYLLNIFKIQFIINYSKPINIPFACVKIDEWWKSELLFDFEINQLSSQIRMMTMYLLSLLTHCLTNNYYQHTHTHTFWIGQTTFDMEMFMFVIKLYPKLIHIRKFSFSSCSYCSQFNCYYTHWICYALCVFVLLFYFLYLLCESGTKWVHFIVLNFYAFHFFFCSLFSQTSHLANHFMKTIHSIK